MRLHPLQTAIQHGTWAPTDGWPEVLEGWKARGSRQVFMRWEKSFLPSCKSLRGGKHGGGLEHTLLFSRSLIYSFVHLASEAGLRLHYMPAPLSFFLAAARLQSTAITLLTCDPPLNRPIVATAAICPFVATTWDEPGAERGQVIAELLPTATRRARRTRQDCPESRG